MRRAATSIAVLARVMPGNGYSNARIEAGRVRSSSQGLRSFGLMLVKHEVMSYGPSR